MGELKVKISFAHSVNRFELEINQEDITKLKLPKAFEFSSRTRGKEQKSRYITNGIMHLVAEMEDYEDNRQEAMKDYVGQVFTKFFEKKVVFDKFLRVLAELDCLCS